jgi:hypothetical protein
MTYKELLKHPKWRKRREEILERDNWQCTCCHSSEESLNVHHRRYIPGRKPWEYPDEELATFCEVCHVNHHKVSDAYNNFTLQGKLQFLLKMVEQNGEQPETKEYNEFLFVAHKEHPKVCYIFYIPTGRFRVFHLSVQEAYEMMQSKPELQKEMKELIFEAPPYMDEEE